MGEKDIERMLGAMEERSVRTLEAVERIDERQIDIEKRIRKLEQKDCTKHDEVVHDINDLKIKQETIVANSTLEDERIRGMIKINNVKISAIVSGLTTLLILIAQWLMTHLKIG